MFNKIDFMKKALDASWMKQEVISSNMVNVNTPGYKRKTVAFEDQLRSYMAAQNGTGVGMRATDPRHMGTVDSFQPQVNEVNDTSFRRDGNNVNIDVEMAEEAKNTIQYNYLSKQITEEFRRLRLAIRDGR